MAETMSQEGLQPQPAIAAAPVEVRDYARTRRRDAMLPMFSEDSPG